MTASVGTWESYARLLLRLCPNIGHIVFSGADAQPFWSSDPSSPALLRSTLQSLSFATAGGHSDADGVIMECAADAYYGFRIRGGLDEVLGFVALGVPAHAGVRQGVDALHFLIKPALDCLQSELSARAAIGELNDDLADNSRDLDLLQRLSEVSPADGLQALAQVPEIALERLSGMVAAVLLPARNVTICRTRPGQPLEAQSALLAQMHSHLMTRAQLHGCTLVANRLSLDGSNAAVPYKAISTPILDEARRVTGVLAVFRVDTDADFQLRDAEALELLARKAAQIIRSSFDPMTGLLTTAAFSAQTAAKLATPELRQSTHGLLYVDIDQLNVVNE